MRVISMDIIWRILKGKYIKFFTALFSLMLLPTILLFVLRVEKEEIVLVKEITADSINDILEFQDTLIVPTLYHNIHVLDSLEGHELKKTFVEIMLPAVLIAKHNIENERKKLIKLTKKRKWDVQDSSFFKGLKKEYKAKGVEELLEKLQTHPNSIVLAQAAVESGWGRSRFCKEANNIFGIWSYNENEPRIKAQFNRGAQEIYLKKYENLSGSIEDYFKVISKARAYEKFRKEKQVNSDPYELVNHLSRYSERRWKYVEQLKSIMRQNNLLKYDRYKIHPDFLKVERSIN